MNTQDYGMMRCLDNGIKDVIWVSYDETLINKLINKGYYRKKVNNIWDEPSYFFFRYKEDKVEFMKECYESIKNKDIAKVHHKVGELLGFPPKASRLFYEKQIDGTLRNNIFVNFCDMHFASYPESIKEDIDWLIQTKPLIDGEIILVGSYKFTIGEDNWLNSLYKTVSSLSN